MNKFSGRLAAVMAAALVVSIPQAVPAAIVYDNGPPSVNAGNEMTAWIQAEDFTIGASTITDVRFWNNQSQASGVYNGSISWAIYADASGSPGATLFSGNTAAVTRALMAVSGGFDEYQNNFSIGSINLGAGTYWLGLHNGPIANNGRAEFFWAATNPNMTTPGHEFSLPSGPTWDSTRTEHAFVLYNNPATVVVPEPSTLAMGATALIVGLGLGLRRRAARTA